MRRFSRGDTVIEVLFAITVFSFIAIGGMSLMNKGTALAQKALETGLVRQQMDAQADALRYLNHAYTADYGKNGQATAVWRNEIESRAIKPSDGGAQPFENMVRDGTQCRIPASSFTLNVRALETDPIIDNPTTDTATYAKVRYSPSLGTYRAEGIWIQAVQSPSVTGADDEERPGFYDFHIRACWQSPGQERPVTLGTIVRLYEPRG